MAAGDGLTSSGKILNLQAADAEHIGRVAMTGPNILIIPVQLAFIMWRLYETFGGGDLGVATFVGLATMLFSIVPAPLACARAACVHSPSWG